MNTGLLKSMLLIVAVLIIGFEAVFTLSGFLEKNAPALPEGYEDQDLAVQGANLKGYAIGSEGLLADWYWMKSLQYIGDKVIKNERPISLDNMRELNPRLLYPYLDNATTLDPQFLSIYEYGAMVLPSIDNEQAIKLLEKGIRKNPNSWRLYHDLGYIYWRLKDYEKASEIYAAGAKVAGAPEWMRLMAAKTRLDGGSSETARQIYGQIFNQAEDAQTKENAQLRLWQLDYLDEREAIQKILDEFRSKKNRCIGSWSEILPLLTKVKLPNGLVFHVDGADNLIDPSGNPYALDRKICEVNVDASKSKIPVQ